MLSSEHKIIVIAQIKSYLKKKKLLFRKFELLKISKLNVFIIFLLVILREIVKVLS